VDEQEATELAHEEFSVLNDDLPEHYNQDTIHCTDLPDA
jgi:hypothetical protein